MYWKMKTQYKVVVAAIILSIIFVKTEKRVLVKLKMNQDDESKLDQLNNVEQVFKVERNMGDHMLTDEAELESWDYVILTGDLPGDSYLKYTSYLYQQPYIIEFKVHPFDIKTWKSKMINLFVQLKGLYVKYISGTTLTEYDFKDSEFGKTFIGDICGNEARTSSEQIMIVNILKAKDGNDEFSIYEKACLMDLFPIVDARVHIAGEAVSNYWQRIALVEYPRSGFCDMATSVEMQNIIEFKRRGLQDSQTYLTKRIR